MSCIHFSSVNPYLIGNPEAYLPEFVEHVDGLSPLFLKLEKVVRKKGSKKDIYNAFLKHIYRLHLCESWIKEYKPKGYGYDRVIQQYFLGITKMFSTKNYSGLENKLFAYKSLLEE